jgi:hypothetical protein
MLMVVFYLFLFGGWIGGSISRPFYTSQNSCYQRTTASLNFRHKQEAINKQQGGGLIV